MKPKKHLKTLEEIASLPGGQSSRLTNLDWFMLYWIGEATGKESAPLLAEIVRDPLTALYEKHRAKIERLQAHAREEDRIKEDNHDDPQPSARRPRR